MEHVTLNNGVKMPMIGSGVFQVNDQKRCQEAVETAIEVGHSAAYDDQDPENTRWIGTTKIHE